MTTAVQDYTPGPLFAGDRASFPLLRHVVNNLQQNGGLEFGVADGTSLAIMADRFFTFGFDSFQGLPEDWGPYPRGSRACSAQVVFDKVAFCHLVVGMFADTLPTFDFALADPIGLVHIDCDLYSSTKTVLQYVGPHLKPGCYIVFDEWFGHDWYELHEQRAWREYTQDKPITWSVVGRDSEAWAIRIETV